MKSLPGLVFAPDRSLVLVNVDRDLKVSAWPCHRKSPGRFAVAEDHVGNPTRFASRKPCSEQRVD